MYKRLNVLLIISLIMALCTGLSVSGQPDITVSPSPTIAISPTVTPSPTPTVVLDQIKIDGKSEDWSEKYLAAINSENKNYAIYGTIGMGKLYILIKGDSFYLTTKNYIYIDSDNNPQTGYKYWRGSGADYYINSFGDLYIYTGKSEADPWEKSVRIEFYKTDSLIEAAIPLELLKFNALKEIKVGHYFKTTDGKTKHITPDVAGTMATVMPDVIFPSIPNAIGLAIDDAGWLYWNRQDRNYKLEDYQTIVNVGKRSGTRPMTAWILMDLDKTGVIANPEYNPPISKDYLNARGKWKKPNEQEVNTLMDFVKNNAAYLEFGLHGVSHAYFKEPSNAIVSEWAFLPEGIMGEAKPWDIKDMQNHADAAVQIIRQYFDESTCPFPKSFVPPSHGYYYNNGDEQSTGALLSAYGVKYANGDVKAGTKIVGGAIDHGLIFINRMFGAPNYDMAKTPFDKFNYYPGDEYGWTEAHFPNLWDGEEKWVQYLKGINNNAQRYLPANTAQCSSQWLYKNYAAFSSINKNTAVLDTTAIPQEAYTKNLLGTLVLKTKLNKNQHISSCTIDNGAQVMGYKEDEFGYGYILIGNKENTMGRLNKGIYNIQCTLGDKEIDNVVDIKDATYNLYSYSQGVKTARLSLEMYGQQTVRLKLPFEARLVQSNNPNLTVNSWSYEAPYLTVNLTGKNIVGEEAVIDIKSYVEDISVNNATGTYSQSSLNITASIVNNQAEFANPYILILVFDSSTHKLIQCDVTQQQIQADNEYKLNKVIKINPQHKQVYSIIKVIKN